MTTHDHTLSDPPRLLFDDPTKKVFTIPPGIPFLAVLAQYLIDRFGLYENRAALADALIYLPNRRSVRSFSLTLYQKLEKKGFISPHIRTLGAVEEGEAFWVSDASAFILPAIAPMQRLDFLAKLVRKWYHKRNIPAPPRSVLNTAQSLAQLLDQAALAGGVDWDKLNTFAAEADLAEHWEISADFLTILTQFWPDHLKESGCLEPYQHQLALAQMLAQKWQDKPPQTPVIIAGSTGAMPASRVLIKAAMQLPNACIILPGLDRDASKLVWQEIAKAPSHPQHVFVQTLKDIGKQPQSVALWPGTEKHANANARQNLIYEMLSPPELTGDWVERLRQGAPRGQIEDWIRTGVEGFQLIEAETPYQEALLAAIMLCEAAQVQGKSAALISPDPAIARQTHEILKRWGININPSAGIPVLHTAPGTLLGLICNWLDNPADAVHLAALLKAEAVSLGFEADRFRLGVSALERGWLRRPAIWQDLPDMIKLMETEAAKIDQQDSPLDLTLHEIQTAIDLVTKLHTFTQPIIDQLEKNAHDGRALATGLYQLVNILNIGQILDTDEVQPESDSIWTKDGGETTIRLLEDLAQIAPSLADKLEYTDLSHILTGLAHNRFVLTAPGSHPQLEILGLLEARLQQRDLIILAGLNEGVWPAPAISDEFLPRHLRLRLGLPDPETRLGLSTHDFAQLACAPEIVCLRAKRDVDGPSLASRWIWRLKVLCEGVLGTAEAEALLTPPKAQEILSWAKRLDQPDKLKISTLVKPPAPRPPLSARPKSLSVTQIPRLIRDPYAVYADKILGLRPLALLGEKAGVRQIGIAVHKALERWQALPELQQAAEHLFEEVKLKMLSHGVSPAEWIGLQAGFEKACQDFADWHHKRLEAGAESYTEIKGKWLISQKDGLNFTLTARADRIELYPDGSAHIIDFKTGGIKTDKELVSGLEPQLPLEALILKEGQFENLPKTETEKLIYIAIKSKFAEHITCKTMSAEEFQAMLDKQRRGFLQLIARYADPNTPYLSRPRVKFQQQAGDYDRLSRRAEWAEYQDELENEV